MWSGREEFPGFVLALFGELLLHHTIGQYFNGLIELTEQCLKLGQNKNGQ